MELNQRLRSLDILRGLTIAGMIIVNDPGSWAYVFPPLRHADWHGITPTDLVFPFFLFIVGVSVVLAYSKRLQSHKSHGPHIRKLFIRAAMIFGMGLYLAVGSKEFGTKVFHVIVGILILIGFSDLQDTKVNNVRKAITAGAAGIGLIVLMFSLPDFNPANFRIPGVLQRIAIVFLLCALLFLKTKWRTQAIIGAVLVVGYWLLMALVPVPIDEVVAGALSSGEVLSSAGMIKVEGISAISDRFIAANLEPGVNLEAWIDRHFVPGRIYQKTWDPEGLLSTLPSVATGICGMMAGHILLATNKKEVKANHLFVMGFCFLLIGNVWDWFFPFNKNLWSSSFVMYTAGLSTLTLAALYWWVDVREKGAKNPLFMMGQVFGANAITAYVLHSLFARIYSPVQKGFMDTLMGWGLMPELASLLFAIDYMLFIYLIVWLMYRRKIFLKW
ncbi:MAG: heparan-alpha-glucosaminide N-acetyltransferase domain-containing protein [Bacteroidota bacterium]